MSVFSLVAGLHRPQALGWDRGLHPCVLFMAVMYPRAFSDMKRFAVIVAERTESHIAPDAAAHSGTAHLLNSCSAEARHSVGLKLYAMDVHIQCM